LSHASPTIFLVDDDESFCRAIDRLLRSAGCRVQTFASAEAFLERLPADGPGCVLLDMKMPGLNGLDAQEALNRSDRTWPIVFLTGHGDIPTSVQAMKAGAVDFLTKPFEDAQFLAVIDQALARDAAERAARAEQQALETRVGVLTAREYEVFCWVVTGLLNKQIAVRLGTTEKTVKVHRSRVMEKLTVGSLAELVQIAHRLGIRGPFTAVDSEPCWSGPAYWRAMRMDSEPRSCISAFRRALVA
jgi:FixJ family two-component response regulator